MEASLDLSRWREKPRGVAYRRWVILSHGLAQVFRPRFFRFLLFVAWAAGMGVGAIAFLFSQSVASGGWLESLAAHFGPRLQAIASALGGFILLYPDVCIRGLYTTIFWLQSYVGLGLSLIALSVVVPGLITRDRASQALTIYLARPLTSLDYLLGKLGVVVGILALVWTGPLIAGWLVSILFAPNRDFIIYSFAPLLRALSFNGVALLVLAPIALGVSALTRSSRATIVLWIGLWVIAGTLAKGPHAPSWLKRASFSHDLSEVRQSVFRLDSVLLDAGKQLPLLNRNVTETFDKAGEAARPKDLPGAVAGLGILVVLSSSVFLRKLRAE